MNEIVFTSILIIVWRKNYAQTVQGFYTHRVDPPKHRDTFYGLGKYQDSPSSVGG